ncbi:MAG: hypothetical protein KAG64_06510 [Bacteroidales bacterium]|nr:hypothetical protein [Bacteroidales bacterium]
MKKKIATIFLLLSLMSIIGIISCSKCDNATVYEVVDIYFDPTGVQYNGNNLTPDRLYFFDIYHDTIYYSFYGIYMEPDLRATASLEKGFNNFGLISTAYACDPVPASTNDRILDIKLFADNDFDDAHPKGSNLADCFDIVVTYEHTNTIDVKYKLIDYLARKPIVPDRMVLILTTKPKQNTKLAITLKYIQEGHSFSSVEETFNSITLTQ